MVNRAAATLALCVSFAAFHVEGQNIFALPGASSSSQTATVFAANPLGPVGGLATGTGPFMVVAVPGGNQYYIVSSGATGSVVSVTNTFGQPQTIANLSAPATAAAITSDGRRLVVLAGTIHVYDVASGTELTPAGGLTPAAGFTIADIATGLGGAQLYAVGSAGSTAQMYVYNVGGTVPALTNTVPLSAPAANNVSVGYNGLIYVSETNQVQVFNPNTLTAIASISLTGRPGKLVFSPDGLFAFAANQSATGPGVYAFSLSDNTLANTASASGAQFTALYPLNSGTIYAQSQSNGLYQLSFNPSTKGLGLSGVALSDVNGATINSAKITASAISNEIAVSSGAMPTYLFAVANNTLYRINIATGKAVDQVNLTGTPASLTYVAPGSTGTPITMLPYGNNQVLAAGAQSSPIVVRVLDSVGHPLVNSPVTFSSSTAGVKPNPASVVTDGNGFAATSVTAPATAGSITVTATDGSLSVPFTITVGNSGSEGSGTTVTGLHIVAGQGQVLFEQQSTVFTHHPLTVQLTDASGNPIANTSVTFSITGPGSLIGVFGTSVSIPTDANGQASVDFLSTTVPSGQSFIQAKVTASTAGGLSATFWETTVSNVPSSSGGPPTVVLTAPASLTLSGAAGSVLSNGLSATVVSETGTPIPNVSLFIDNTGVNTTGSPTAACVDATGNGILTNASGIATCDVKLGPVVGSTQATVDVGYLRTYTVGLKVTPGVPAQAQIAQGNNQSGPPGQQLPVPLVVTITDAAGNALGGIPVTWTVASGTATLVNTVSTTDFKGRASTSVKLGSTAGPVIIKVAAGTGSASATFTETVNVVVSALTVEAGNNQTAVLGQQFTQPIGVKVTDATGAAVPGVAVTFAVSSGDATLANPTTTTDNNGLASTYVTAGQTAGPITITASAGNSTATFSLTAREPGPTNVNIVNGASFQNPCQQFGATTTFCISPGEIVTITGTGIATGLQGVTAPQAIIGPLPTTLEGISVTFNGVSAPIYNVANVNGQESVTVQVPYDVGTTGTATVVITGAGGGSATVTNTAVQPFAPGLFTTSVFGDTQVVAVRPDGSYVSPANPAKGGDTIRIFATGLGATNTPSGTNLAGIEGQTVANEMDIGLNGAVVPLVSATLVPGLVGVYEVAFQVPADVTGGTAVPVGLVMHTPVSEGYVGYFVQFATMPVQ